SHTFQLIEKAGRDRYTGTGALLPASNDFTGYMPSNGSSQKGYIALNHEANPGGVSILDLHFDATATLWRIDTISKIDYATVVKAADNCAGTITPWGTSVSSEETYDSSDADNDGYEDIGWNTEIDPITRKIIDHDGDGKPEKLWAMGRMNHEN